jgi:hypothetical protein
MILTQNFGSPSTVRPGNVGVPVVRTVTRTLTADPVNGAGATVYDSEFISETSGAAWTETDLFYELGQNYVFECLTPSIACITGNTVTLVGSGGLWEVSVNRGVSRIILKGNNTVNSRTVEYFDQFTPLSLSDVLADGILDLIVGGKTDSFYTAYTGNPTTLTPSTTCWAEGVDLSFCAVSTQNFTSWTAANRGALITPRHAVVCVHFGGPPVGGKMRYRGSDGSMNEVTVIGSAQIGDARVLTYGSALPATVTPVEVAGDWMVRNIASASYGTASYYLGGAFFWPDQFFRCRFQMGGTYRSIATTQVGVPGYTINGRFYENRPYTFSTQPASSFTSTPSILVNKDTFCTYAITGDSGSPVCAMVSGQAVLLGVWTGASTPTNCTGDNFLNDLIAEADVDAGVSTGLAVTVAPDPTI